MKSTHVITFSLALAALVPSAHAQFNGGGFNGGGFSTGQQQTPPPTAWAKFALNPKVRVNLDFRNASIDAVLHMLSQASGVAIIKDPALTGGITLQSPKPQSLNDAFAILNAVLNLKNYELSSEGNFLLVRPRQAVRSTGGFGGFGGNAAAGGFGGFGGRTTRRTQTELQTYVLRYADATAMARVINDVFATTTNGQNAAAFALLGGAAAGGNTGGGGRGGRRGGGGNTTASTDATASPVKASADSYSNALIVNATSAQQDQIATILNQVDVPTDNPQHAQVFKLTYALASDLQTVIQNILSGSSTLGRGATGSNNQQNRGGGGGFGGFFGRFGGGGNTNSSTANGTVTADPRTNTLVVTATPANLQQVAQVIQTLDKPATYTSSTFVYVMKNARADVVANLLNQSFGNRTTNGPTGGSLTNPSISSGTLSTNSGSTTPGSLTGNTTNTRNNTNNATVTSGNTNQQNQTPSTTGLDSDGRFINIRNLSGSVLLVPNIDTNSIIVVAPPEDRAIIESILETMDEIPEQVMIETLVVETNLTKANQLGVEYNIPFLHGSTTQSFGQQANVVQPQGLRYTLTAGQYSVFLKALQTDTQFDVLSTPRIFTTNNATAQINISQSLPYVTNSTFDTNGTQIFNYNFLDVGIVLTVTPRITSNGYVTMDVTQTANDFVGYTSFNAPIVNQREAQTTVSVKDGETVVLGGIINNSLNKTVNKVPVLGDIPLLGSLFRSTTTTKDKTELLVFMTPHVVRTPEDAARLRAQTEIELGKTARGMLPTATPAPTPQPAARVSPPVVPTASGSTVPAASAPVVTTTVIPTPVIQTPAVPVVTTPTPAPPIVTIPAAPPIVTIPAAPPIETVPLPADPAAPAPAQ